MHPILTDIKMKVRLLTPLATLKGSKTVGDIYECSKEEAQRFIERGYAEPLKAKSKKK